MSNDFNNFRVHIASYDIAHPRDKQVQVVFHLKDDAPFENKVMGFVVWDEGYGDEDFDTVYDAAVACNNYIKNRLYDSDKPKIAKLVEYLETTKYTDKLGALKFDEARILRRLENVRKQISLVEQEMEENE